MTDFPLALENLMRLGCKVRRQCWPPCRYLEFVPSTTPGQPGTIYDRTTGAAAVHGWKPLHSDIVALDWRVVG